MATELKTLAWMIDPVTPEEFFRDYWEKKPLVIKRNGKHGYFDRVLTMDALDHAITTLHLSHPDISIADARREVKLTDYTFNGGLIDVVRLMQHYVDGSTIILNQLDRYHTPLTNFCRGLERDTSTRFQANIYLTPGDAQGFRTHFDSHDVFVMQIHGTKHWRLYDTPIELPFRGQSFEDLQPPIGNVTAEFVMEAGDVVYVPRGVLHDAVTKEGESLHITVGALQTSWTELLLETVASVALHDPEFRKSLPVGFLRNEHDRAEAEKTFRTLLSRVVERADLAAAFEHFADDLVTTRHVQFEGQLAQVRRIAGINPDTRAGARAGTLYRLRETENSVVVNCHVGEITLPRHAADTLRFALENSEYRVGALPGDLDDAGKVVLVKRLVREGLVRLL